MKINELASVPKLVQIDIDDKHIVEKYGEVITFWTHDVVSLANYFDFFDARGNVQYDRLTSIVKRMILLEDGTPALKENEDLPIDIAVVAINKLAANMGKSRDKSSTKRVGKRAK